jgi:hypothetical protein
MTTDSEEKTVVIQSPTRKKSKIPLVLGLLCLLVLAGSGLTAWLLFNNYSRQTKNVRDNRKADVNVKSSSGLPTIPKPASTANSLVVESSPKEDDSKKTSDDENSANGDSANGDSEDVTPIAWDTTPSAFKGEEGQIYTFRCPEMGSAQTIYGSDIYTDYSSICTAAVHAGLISLARGGVVTIEFRPGRSIYGSTTRHGIKSNTAGEYRRSFGVR